MDAGSAGGLCSLYGFRWFYCLYGIRVFVGASCIYCLSRFSLFYRVYLSSMLFCACSSVNIAIGIINAYMLVICLYVCSYIVCAAVPCLSCAGGQAGTVCKLSLCLCLCTVCAFGL